MNTHEYIEYRVRKEIKEVDIEKEFELWLVENKEKLFNDYVVNIREDLFCMKNKYYKISDIQELEKQIIEKIENYVPIFKK